MDPVLIVYATQEGHTSAIAHHVAEVLVADGFSPRVVGAAEPIADVEVTRSAAVILAASVHAGTHEPEMEAFVRRHLRELNGAHTAFISVSLTEATVEDPTRPEDERLEATQEVERTIERFFDDTGWRPDVVTPTAGALMYSKYGWVKRLMMSRIARQAGRDGDTSHDHVYTDWDALDRFVLDFARERPGVT
jgi:menaquinone-dependent protoporphyrinogen oxidase